MLLDLSISYKDIYAVGRYLGSSFLSLGANAIDQVTTQRALCCKNITEACKAVAFSAIGAVTTWIMLLVGLALVAFYHINPLTAETAKAVRYELIDIPSS